MGSARMKATIVVNPHAGKQNILKELDGVKAAFEEAGYLAEAVVTEDAGEAQEVIRQAVAGSPDVLVCCGGDGTLSETVSQVLDLGAQVLLGYIPAGTTNDFASSLGIPKEPVKAARKIASGVCRELDAGRLGDRRFIYVASFGAFTQSSYNTDQGLKNALGHFAYVLEGLKELPALKSYRVKAETAEGGVFDGEYIFGAVSNSTSLGGMIKLDPQKVALDDGELELTLIKTPKNLLEFNRIVFSLMSGKFDEEFVTLIHTRQVVFTCAEPMDWSLDGEYAPGGERMEAEVLPRAMRLVY